MRPYKVDVPVLLIFFARPTVFAKVFEQVKLARPSKLFLYQDGPRVGRLDDAEKIRKCREIAESVDWECEVHKFYQPSNVGCDPSEFVAQKWAFGIVDRCIVLEDDDVPAQSFFPFCAELLERYKNDERINMICGMNHLGVSEGTPYDYLFSISGSICGWASWRRVIDTWDEGYAFLEDGNALRVLNSLFPKSFYISQFIRSAARHKRSGVAHYESISAASYLLNSRLNIVATKNMISNIGLGADAVHTASSLEDMPKGVRRVFYMKTHEIQFPLKHPRYVVCDMEHVNGVFGILGYGHYCARKCRALEDRFLRIRKRLKGLFGIGQ
jgi:hypothetical protein